MSSRTGFRQLAKRVTMSATVPPIVTLQRALSRAEATVCERLPSCTLPISRHPGTIPPVNSWSRTKTVPRQGA